MSIVHHPLASFGPTSPKAHASIRSMEVGQHVLAVSLTVIGVVRTALDGTSLISAISVAVAILAWHAAGTLLPNRKHSKQLVFWWLMGLALLWLVAVAVSAEFVWLSFLLWLLAGHLLSLWGGLAFSVVVFVVVVAAPILHHGTISYGNVLGPLVGGIFAFTVSRFALNLLKAGIEQQRLVESLTHTQREMAELQDELALAQRNSGAQEERTRVSRDIHDTVAQSLSSIRLIAHAGGSRTTDAAAEQTLRQVESLAADSLSDVRRIIAALAPQELDNAALAGALQRLLDRLEADTDLSTELHVDESVPALPTRTEVTLLRTAQSALANVRRHAQASRVVVSLIDTGDGVQMDIIDNGIGFDVAEWESSPESGSSFGLRFMRARLRELGGALDVTSEPGARTEVSARLPLAPQRLDPTVPSKEST